MVEEVVEVGDAFISKYGLDFDSTVFLFFKVHFYTPWGLSQCLIKCYSFPLSGLTLSPSYTTFNLIPCGWIPFLEGIEVIIMFIQWMDGLPVKFYREGLDSS